jgi:hypothetical protein
MVSTAIYRRLKILANEFGGRDKKEFVKDRFAFLLDKKCF